jgi:hypothetical protein
MHGKSIGTDAERLLDSPLPWTRQVYALRGWSNASAGSCREGAPARSN